VTGGLLVAVVVISGAVEDDVSGVRPVLDVGGPTVVPIGSAAGCSSLSPLVAIRYAAAPSATAAMEMRTARERRFMTRE
jgi:hypothetical protein